MRLTWNYIAGFFDGEGCVTTHTNRARRGAFGTQVIISQSRQRGYVLLTEIQQFLATVGIRSYVLRVNKQAPAPQWNLVMAARPSVEEFLRQMRGRVAIKRVIVEDTLRFLQLFPSTRSSATIERNKLGTLTLDTMAVRADRAAGLSWSEIRVKYDMAVTTIRRKLREVAA